MKSNSDPRQFPMWLEYEDCPLMRNAWRPLCYLSFFHERVDHNRWELCTQKLSSKIKQRHSFPSKQYDFVKTWIKTFSLNSLSTIISSAVMEQAVVDDLPRMLLPLTILRDTLNSETLQGFVLFFDLFPPHTIDWLSKTNTLNSPTEICPSSRPNAKGGWISLQTWDQ